MPPKLIKVSKNLTKF